MQIGVEMSKTLENKRVFVVDDNEIFRAALQFMLHDDYETHEVADAAQAIGKAKSQTPDLVIVAESLVRAEGLALVQKLKDAMPKTRLLVVVDAMDSGFGKECVGAGAHGYIAKPLKIEFVRQKVDSILGRGKAVTIPLTVLTAR